MKILFIKITIILIFVFIVQTTSFSMGTASKSIFKQGIETTTKSVSKNSIKNTTIRGAYGGSSKVLSARLGIVTGSGFQAHHILPIELKSHRILNKIGFDMDCIENGISLPGTSGLHPTLPIHNGYHSGYTQKARRMLDQIPYNLSHEETKKKVFEVISKLRNELNNGKPLYNTEIPNAWE